MKCSDISVGEYVRNIYGYIGKYTKNSNGIYEIKIRDGLVCRINSKEEIVKHSKNIIDLIEEGDYVNGKRVIKANCRFTYIDDDSSYGESEIENGLDLGDELIYWSSEIKSIITKEQIKQIEFIVKE